MKKITPKSDEVWYVDFDASNHMTCHKEWFLYLEKPMQPGVVASETTLRIRLRMSVKFP